jgi:hypothetical protein
LSTVPASSHRGKRLRKGCLSGFGGKESTWWRDRKGKREKDNKKGEREGVYMRGGRGECDDGGGGGG